MAKIDKKKMGVIGIIIGLLVGFGGNTMLTQEQINKGYVCNITEELGFFDRISGSAKTGYYVVNGVEESEQCREGYDFDVWIPLTEYAEREGVSPQEFLMKEDDQEQNVTEYAKVCNERTDQCWTCKTPIKPHERTCIGSTDSVLEIMMG